MTMSEEGAHFMQFLFHFHSFLLKWHFSLVFPLPKCQQRSDVDGITNQQLKSLNGHKMMLNIVICGVDWQIFFFPLILRVHFQMCHIFKCISSIFSNASHSFSNHYTCYLCLIFGPLVIFFLATGWYHWHDWQLIAWCYCFDFSVMSVMFFRQVQWWLW